MANQRSHPDGETMEREQPRKGDAPPEARGGRVSSLRKRPSATATTAQTKLRARLNTAEETLRAIRSGEVDALMVSGRRGDHAVTLSGGDHAYRMLVEAMSEGAATLSRDGAVLYCNGRFAEMTGAPIRKLLEAKVQSLLAEGEQDRFQTLLIDARKAAVRGEFNLRCSEGRLLPVYLSLNRFRGFKGLALGMVITDLSQQKHKQAVETKRAEATQRLLLERTLSAQEEERRRIARELHDEAGQLLTALLVGLRTLEDTRKMAEVKVQGQRLREITAQAIEELGRLARGLHSTVLDDHGLGVALSRYVAEYAMAHKITVDLALNERESNDLPSGVQITLYRILQEALTNVARHSGAKAVSIHFARTPTAIEVEVSDDGCGFDAKAVSVSSHRLGIHGMRERAAILGGTVRFISQHKGTRIVVQLPLASHASQPGARQKRV